MIVYFIAIMLFGSYFSKYNRSTNDFFFGGRRFKWWLIAFSIVATGVGSHSFIKYSAMGFEHGISSTMAYINDWFFIPFFMFGWLPIIIYTRIRSIPEYFEKRFSPSARFVVTLFLLLYMVGYVGIGFLTMGKAILPMLPESFSIFGFTIHITLMGLISVIAIITGIYITFGGQTAVIFTDLAQGIILLFAGFLVFILGLDYLGGFHTFWNILPTEWKLPLANYNSPTDFNFVGIFWQDAIAGSIGFLFMNMGLIMRFMATKSVDEGRKAAAFNIIFMLPLSAIVVSNAGWIGKAISIINPDIVSPGTAPDQIFVVVSNIISQPGVFGFIMAALTAALMSTVDTLINATAAVYINDVHRPIKKLLKKFSSSEKIEDKKELSAARVASVFFTLMGVLAVIPFNTFPTIYEAHGYFHATLTPPLVIAIFLGVFWKRFTPAGVITTFLGGSALMIIGAKYPGILIAPFDHGIFMDPVHPYTYISALYNLVVCLGVALLVTYTSFFQRKIVEKIRNTSNHKNIMRGLVALSALLLATIIFEFAPLPLLIVFNIILIITIALTSTYFIKYDETKNTEGLTAWSISKAKEMFKGRKINDREGQVIKVHWKMKNETLDVINFSRKDMEKMSANAGDLVYLCDARRYLGGLKSIHSSYGKPHNQDGIVYINEEHLKTGLFKQDKLLTAEKEM